MFLALQAPEYSYGYWHHYSLTYAHRYSYDGKLSKVEFFVDGESLCGQTFPADRIAPPHTRHAQEQRTCSWLFSVSSVRTRPVTNS